MASEWMELRPGSITNRESMLCMLTDVYIRTLLRKEEEFKKNLYETLKIVWGIIGVIIGFAILIFIGYVVYFTIPNRNSNVNTDTHKARIEITNPATPSLTFIFNARELKAISFKIF